MNPAGGAASELPAWFWPRSAYIHVPFCAHRCGYCDFAIAVGQDERIDDYLQALGTELARLERPQPVRTLFLGGGTPSHLSPRQLASLFETIRRWLMLEPGAEVSIEVNPAGLDADKIRVLADHGVTRVCLGAQSFDLRLLRVLERDHDPHDVFRAAERIRRRITNVSIDLIFGVPGQELRHWQVDLEQALALDPEHISTYGLTYEKGTPLWKQRRRGDVRPVGEDAERDMYVAALDRLAAAGFEHYEISNHARPGWRCRHNAVYWANEAHFGFGLGAASYVRGVRRLNTRDLRSYLRRAGAGARFDFQSEELAAAERAVETAVIQLRRAEGIIRDPFAAQTGHAADAVLGAARTALVGLGLLADDETSIRLTREGMCVADAVVQEVMKAASAPPV